MKQEIMTMRIRVENRKNIIRRKSDGQSFGKGLIIRIHDGDSPDNYEEVSMEQDIVETSNIVLGFSDRTGITIEEAEAAKESLNSGDSIKFSNEDTMRLMGDMSLDHNYKWVNNYLCKI